MGQNGDVAQRVVRIPGIEPVALPDLRQSTPVLHGYLRECILDGRLPPGTKLSQVTLAEQLGVSRTPLREVLRMLQEEGFVEFEPNQRMRVAGLDPAELDADYASRVLLENLALSMTLDEFGGQQKREAKQALTAMRRAARSGDVNAWFTAHVAFHQLITAGAPAPMRRQLDALADRSVRYIRISQLSDPTDWPRAGDVEHPAILHAVADGDGPGARAALAHHLERTAVRVLARCAPDYTPSAVPQAVALVTGEGLGAAPTGTGP
jgi:DNA-binding GntR family transcriptional regulator